MLTFSRIRVLIEASSVKLSQSVGIPRKMRRNPVQDNTDLMSVQVIDHICKILRCSVAGRRCKISCYLISPGTVKRILGNSHHFYMGVTHFLYIFCQFYCQFTVCIKAGVFLIACMTFPGTRMHFINGHWLTVHLVILMCRTCFHPFFIGPFQLTDICDF